MFSKLSSGAVALVALQLALGASSAEVNFSLNLTNAVVAPDGYTRSAVLANGRMPGPLISGNIGDRFLINVTDSLTDSTMMRATAVHWHGLTHKMDHAVSMDGTSSITQCPIVPGHSFMYNFTCSEQSGTFWYHSHYSTQYCDGLWGPLVIYDPEDPLQHLYDIDDESTIITLQDWYHQAAPTITDLAPPTPDSSLINGLGRWSVNPTSELAVVRGQPGKRHRFRILNAACFPAFNFTIEGHKLTVIEADGIETEPHEVDTLQIFAGQRYSVVVTMDKPVGNYWIRAIPNRPINSTTVDGINSAILRYDGAPTKEPASRKQPKDLTRLKESDLHTLSNPGVPGEPYPGGADVVLTMKPQFNDGTWLLNNHTFSPPSKPVLLQILSGAGSAQDLLPSGSFYDLPPNATVEVTIIGIADHPFHLHGHAFDVVSSAGDPKFNFLNPVRRDVVSAGQQNDNVTIRFVTDNAGPWFFHCHVDWHLEGGLGVVFAEDTRSVQDDDPVNDDWKNLCPLFDKLNPDVQLERARSLI